MLRRMLLILALTSLSVVPIGAAGLAATTSDVSSGANGAGAEVELRAHATVPPETSDSAPVVRWAGIILGMVVGLAAINAMVGPDGWRSGFAALWRGPRVEDLFYSVTCELPHHGAAAGYLRSIDLRHVTLMLRQAAAKGESVAMHLALPRHDGQEEQCILHGRVQRCSRLAEPPKLGPGNAATPWYTVRVELKHAPTETRSAEELLGFFAHHGEAIGG